MKMTKKSSCVFLFTFLFLAVLLMGRFYVQAESGQNELKPFDGRYQRPDVELQRNANTLMVKFSKSATEVQVRDLASSLGLQAKTFFRHVSRFLDGNYWCLTSKGQISRSVKQKLGRSKLVISFTEDQVTGRLLNTPNDPGFAQQWALNNTGQTGGTADADIDAPEAWDITTGSADVIVGVIDSGADLNHPDLINNLWVNANETAGDGIDNDNNGYVDDVHGINAIALTGNPQDDNGHGTHCSGIIAAAGNNGEGVTGVGWNTRIMALKAGGPEGLIYTSAQWYCIDYVLDQKINHNQNIVALNASYGGTAAVPYIYDAIYALKEAGIIFVAAAGNSAVNNDITPHYPSSYDLPNIIAVASTDHNDAKSSFSCYGANSVDLAAPGSSILSTYVMFDPETANIFSDDMESGADKWETGGTNNTWAITEELELFNNPNYPPPSPTHVWSDSPAANYVADTDSWLAVKDALDLTGYVGQQVFFGYGAAFAVRNGDYIYVEFSKDNGATWTEVDSWTNAGYYFYYPFTLIIAEEFKTDQFKFRFRLVSNSDTTVWAGWLVDSVGVGTNLVSGYASMSGTSMATPCVAGAVGLIAAHHTTDTMAERMLRILTSGDDIASMAGITYTGKRLNINNALNVTEFPPYIASLSQTDLLVPDTEFTIAGEHFGNTQGSVRWLDGSKAEYNCQIVSWTDQAIVVKAPNVARGVYNVMVKNAAETASYNQITIDSWPAYTNMLLSEDFENSFPPAGWQVTDNAGDGLTWLDSDDIGWDNDTGGSGRYITANSYVLNVNSDKTMDTDMLVQEITLGVFERIQLHFNHYYFAMNNSAAAADISTDSGSTWTNLQSWAATSNTGLVKIDLTPYAGQTVKIRFNYKDFGTQSAYWHIDDVKILAWFEAIKKTEDVVGYWEGIGVWQRNSDSGKWIKWSNMVANRLQMADMNGDGQDDLLGKFYEMDGLWLRDAASGSWQKIAVSTSDLIDFAAGDVNGDGKADLFGGWASGIWVRDTASAAWTKWSNLTATQVAAADMDGDGLSDLIAMITISDASEIWVRNAATGAWSKLPVNTQDLYEIAAGDVNGDGLDDFAGTWIENDKNEANRVLQGVWVRDSETGTWTKIYRQSLDAMAFGDLDGDGTDDMVCAEYGIGTWVRYSNTGTWSRLSVNSSNVLSVGQVR